MADRISAARLEVLASWIDWLAEVTPADHAPLRPQVMISTTERDRVVSDSRALVASRAEAWGEAEAATRALRELIEAQDEALEPEDPPNPMRWRDAAIAARALVGSETKEADDE